ncbi:hypothetical protein GII40_00163 [Candidatus Profftia lariciata]|uniref:phospholipase D family nuclease n=1 Tax=Candidatus Profftia lariciata TaxID=1987921 RepID=UPI001D01E7E1|nr:phospholipase D family protein [Candidatus Profftia lariciata]UDG81380.1 hypothetical protein GII40_00163 [Candidatus Profftia lariciata]
MSKLVTFITAIFLLFLTIIISLSANANIQDIEVGFSPGNTANHLVITAIKEAKHSIDIAAYSFTSKNIALSLVDAQQHGINVRIVADKKLNNGHYTALTYLAHHHILVKLNNKYAIMHNKFMIIDGHSVQTGSFNYTQGAVSRNAENVIYLRNRLDITKKYIKEFNRLWNESIDEHYIFTHIIK